jgi:hypothetical protein
MRALILLHRWLGVAFCLFFTMWLTSGIVMHFVPFPRLTEAERLAGLSILAEAEGAEAAVSDVGATITTIFNSTPMTERRNANLFEVLIGQIRQDEKANILLGKPLRVLSETELVEPVRDLLHCSAPSHLPSGEYMRSRGCVLRAGMARIALSESASASFARLIQGEAMACATSKAPPTATAQDRHEGHFHGKVTLSGRGSHRSKCNSPQTRSANI